MGENEFILALKDMHISLTDKQLKQLDEYYGMLVTWNKVMNLTGIVEKKDVYLKHFYDSLTIVKAVDLNKVNNLCDIGTGAGFPGMVLKIVFPNLQVDLVDSLHKRIIFLNEVVQKLQFEKINIIEARAEDYARENRERYDIVTARAVASLPILLEYSIPLLKVQAHFIAMKGNIQDELANSSNAFVKLDCELQDKIDFLLPVENSVRTILTIKKNAKTSLQYPRKFSEMKKKPL